VIETLARVVAAPPGKPVRPEAARSQAESRLLAEHPESWSAERAAGVVRRYGELAHEWESERGNYRPVPLADALERGGPLPAGRCVEVGCGTGLLTPLLTAVWSQLVCLDLTRAMIERSTARWRLLADASRLPLRSGTAAAVVLADVPLFAAEVDRVLAPGGVVIWSNALGADAPHHVPVPTVVAALHTATGTPWSAVTADAGWGLWATLRRAT
jgi:SAM-dependent methyltransferase